MSIFKNCFVLAALVALLCTFSQSLHAVSYVTDTGGYAYDKSVASTNIAAGIALGTVAVVGIIAIAVQNTHESSSSHYGSYDYSSYYDYSRPYYYSCYKSGCHSGHH